MNGCMNGWVEIKAVLRIAYSDQKIGRREGVIKRERKEKIKSNKSKF